MYRKSIRPAAGFGIIEILVVVVVLAIIGGGTYLYFQQANTSKGGSPTTQEQAELKAACKVEIDDDLLCSVFTNWGSVSTESVTYTTTVTDAEGNSYSATSKHDGDNYHSISNFGGQEIEAMQVDHVAYTKMNGMWYKQTLDTNHQMSESETEPDPSSRVDNMFSEESAAKTNYKRIGEETCGNATCVKYEITYVDDTNSTHYFWVDPKSHKLMRTQLKDNDGSSWDMVLSYGPVTITAPADAKDYSQMFSM